MANYGSQECSEAESLSQILRLSSLQSGHVDLPRQRVASKVALASSSLMPSDHSEQVYAYLPVLCIKNECPYALKIHSVANFGLLQYVDV
jgi:hypothetical protein